MSNERDRSTAHDDQLPSGKMGHSVNGDVLNGQPRQVAQVNMLPDEPLDEEHDVSLAADRPLSGADSRVADRGSVESGWGPMAWLLGVLALAISVGVLILVMQGVFVSMPG